jgi:sulfite reductase beta subunit-like hemoprotein
MIDATTREQVLKRNSIERLKAEKFPLDIVHEFPELAGRSYESVAEEDIVRLQWYGLYHDKPKTGFFMMRVKIPGGVLTAAQLRTIGRLSAEYGRGYAELTTRQNVQLHWIRLADLPPVFDVLGRAGFTMAGGCGDTVRNVTGCPVSGIAASELFDVEPILAEVARYFYGNRDYSDLPRKHKITLAACPYHCNLPEMHCIALVGALHAGRPGFAVRVGGGLSTVPRLSRSLGVFVPAGETIEVLRALIDVWQETPKYRMSRVKARLKFMMDDVGPERYRELVEARLGRGLEGFTPPEPRAGEHITGIHPQRQEGLVYAGFPVTAGLVNGDQLLRLADVAEREGAGVRLTREQNFILTHLRTDRASAVAEDVGRIGFPLAAGRLRAVSIACTGSPLCNYAVALTKPRLIQLMEHLEATFGPDASTLRIHLDGCPHACAHHWTGDIGLQGTTLRERTAGGEKQEGYDIYLRGGQAGRAAIGLPVVKRVPGDQVNEHVERLVRLWISEREPGEDFRAFTDRTGDDELVAAATLRPIEEVRAELRPRAARRTEAVDA